MEESVTLIKKATIDHKWTINDFSFHKTMVNSAYFSSAMAAENWILILDPKSSTDFIDVYICLCSEENIKVLVQCEISFWDNGNKRCFLAKSHHPKQLNSTQENAILMKNLLPRSQLLKKVGAENTLQVLCEITLFEESISFLKPILPIMNLSLTGEDISSITEDLTNLPFDVTIELKDGDQVGAHKFMLMSRSKVFKAMFEHEMREKVENKIVIRDMKPSVIKELIHFIYNDNVREINEIAEDLMIAADKYDLLKLKKICEYFLMNTVKPNTVGSLLFISDVYNAPELKRFAINYIVENHGNIKNNWNLKLPKGSRLYEELCDAFMKKRRKV